MRAAGWTPKRHLRSRHTRVQGIVFRVNDPAEARVCAHCTPSLAVAYPQLWARGRQVHAVRSLVEKPRGKLLDHQGGPTRGRRGASGGRLRERFYLFGGRVGREVTMRNRGHGGVGRTAFAWAAGVAITLVVTVASVLVAVLLPLGPDQDHAGWLGVVGFPLGAALGGAVAGRSAGRSIPIAAWAALNPGAAVCSAILVSQGSAHGLGSEYFQELVWPSIGIASVSFGGAVWGRRLAKRVPVVAPDR